MLEVQALRDFLMRRLIVVIAEGFNMIMIHSRHVPIFAATRVEVGIDVDGVIIIIKVIVGIVSNRRHHVHVLRWWWRLRCRRLRHTYL